MDIPLLVAAREGHTPIVRLLVEHGAQVNVMVRRVAKVADLPEGRIPLCPFCIF